MFCVERKKSDSQAWVYGRFCDFQSARVAKRVVQSTSQHFHPAGRGRIQIHFQRSVENVRRHR